MPRRDVHVRNSTKSHEKLLGLPAAGDLLDDFPQLHKPGEVHRFAKVAGNVEIGHLSPIHGRIGGRHHDYRNIDARGVFGKFLQDLRAVHLGKVHVQQHEIRARWIARLPHDGKELECVRSVFHYTKLVLNANNIWLAIRGTLPETRVEIIGEPAGDPVFWELLRNSLDPVPLACAAQSFVRVSDAARPDTTAPLSGGACGC